MLVPYRHKAVDEGYRYGFQGQEKDDEIKGEGNSINFTFRMHDPRVGRFFAIDPLAGKYAYNSPYAFSENMVISSVELEGLEQVSIHSFSFAPYDTFGGGFRGDGENRKFGDEPIETKDKQNYRTGVDIYLDLATSKYLKDKTKLYVTNSIWMPGKNWLFEDSNADDGLVNGETQTQFQEPVTFKKNQLFFQTQGTDAAILWGYNPGYLDVKVRVHFLKITSDELTYEVDGYVYGDRFPSNSTYLKDKVGTKLFLGVSGVDSDSALDPQTGLLGTPFEGMSRFNFLIIFNKDETFKGVKLKNGKFYTPEQWNQIFNDLNPKSEETGTNVTKDKVETNYDPH